MQNQTFMCCDVCLIKSVPEGIAANLVAIGVPAILAVIISMAQFGRINSEKDALRRFVLFGEIIRKRYLVGGFFLLMLSLGVLHFCPLFAIIAFGMGASLLLSVVYSMYRWISSPETSSPLSGESYAAKITRDFITNSGVEVRIEAADLISNHLSGLGPLRYDQPQEQARAETARWAFGLLEVLSSSEVVSANDSRRLWMSVRRIIQQTSLCAECWYGEHLLHALETACVEACETKTHPKYYAQELVSILMQSALDDVELSSSESFARFGYQQARSAYYRELALAIALRPIDVLSGFDSEKTANVDVDKLLRDQLVFSGSNWSSAFVLNGAMYHGLGKDFRDRFYFEGDSRVVEPALRYLVHEALCFAFRSSPFIAQGAATALSKTFGDLDIRRIYHATLIDCLGRRAANQYNLLGGNAECGAPNVVIESDFDPHDSKAWQEHGLNVEKNTERFIEAVFPNLRDKHVLNHALAEIDLAIERMGSGKLSPDTERKKTIFISLKDELTRLQKTVGN